MKTHAVNDDQTGPEDIIVDEAIEWLLCLNNAAPIPQDPYRDPAVRNRAFFEWLKRSAVHLRIFMEFLELEARIDGLDAAAVADIRRLVDLQSVSQAIPAVSESAAPKVRGPTHAKAPSARNWARVAGATAPAVVVLASIAYYLSHTSRIYTTHIGERQERMLSDGSVIELNTNSAVEIDFSRDARDVRLIRGEAYFKVQHDLDRPFTVASDEASVCAVGTEFDIRRNPQSIGVAVISGSVQAAALRRACHAPASALKTSGHPVATSEDTQDALILSAGEMAAISSGKVTRMPAGNVSDEVSWRQNHLVFHDARLAYVAEQFNRYNSIQIRVEGAAAQDTLLTGTFDVGGYEDVLRYARTKKYLLVEQDGNNWVIRSRQ